MEDLFPATPAESWDLLLDLRQCLVLGNDWNRTLDVFLACRRQLEASQYLPFYRLRRLFSESLKLEAACCRDSGSVASLREVLRRKHRSLADIKKAMRRELFEHMLDEAGLNDPFDLLVVENDCR